MNVAAKELTQVLAPNPSALTGPGTNTFLLGASARVVIDPGPDDPSHIDAIMSVAQGRISHILVTHAHLDHSGGAARLAALSGAPVLAFGDATSGRSPRMQALAASGLASGGEGLDLRFSPDQLLRDHDQVETPAGPVTALHTPGHCGGHLCFAWRGLLFSGDIVMGWSSTLISPPDGDLSDYMRSMARIAALGANRLLPAHGPAIDDPAARLSHLIAHRRHRSTQIMTALRDGPATARSLAAQLYHLPDPLLAAATRNVLAHLLALEDLGAIEVKGTISPDAAFWIP